MAEDKKFASVAWEVLNILKENFPSKIFLSQENLEQCKPSYVPLTSGEELRRQISCLMSIKEEDRCLTIDELEDAWHTLSFAEKVNDQRSLNICLEMINSQVSNWASSKSVIDIDTLQRIICKNDYSQLTSNKIIAQEIIDKIQMASVSKVNEMGETFQRIMTNEYQYDDNISLVSDTMINEGTTQFSYEKPTSTRMCLFQLSESNDINRVTMILETLSMKSKELLFQLGKKYHLSTKLFNILKKYCNAEYGFDQQSSRHGTFQFNLLKLFIILSQDYVVFLDCLQSQMLDYLSQIIEEGIIYGYEDALSGANTTNHQSAATIKFSTTTSGLNSDLFKFLRLSMDFMELAISKQYQEFLPGIRDNLRKIQARMVKLIQKKDNPLLAYFITNFTSQSQVNVEEQQNTGVKENNVIETEIQCDDNCTIIDVNCLMSVDQLTELKGLSDSLYDFSVKLNNKIQKVEALIDLQEGHEDKYSRLFYKFMGLQTKIKQQDFNQITTVPQQQRNDKSGQTRVHFDIEQKYHRRDEMPLANQTYEKIPISNNYDNSYVTQKDNIFKKNQLEGAIMINTKNQITTNQKQQESLKQQNYTMMNPNKENDMHYIGSPNEPSQKKENQKVVSYGRDINTFQRI